MCAHIHMEESSRLSVRGASIKRAENKVPSLKVQMANDTLWLSISELCLLWPRIARIPIYPLATYYRCNRFEKDEWNKILATKSSKLAADLLGAFLSVYHLFMVCMSGKRAFQWTAIWQKTIWLNYLHEYRGHFVNGSMQTFIQLKGSQAAKVLAKYDETLD